MNRYTVHFSLKKVKRVPKRMWISWLVATLLLLCLIVELCLPAYRMLDNTEQREIQIDNVRLRSTKGTLGYRYQLIITEGNDTFYLSLSSSEYKRIEDKLQNELLSGKITSVTATIVNNRSIQDTLSNRDRIMGLKSSSTVYYGLDSAKNTLLQARIDWWFLFIPVSIVWGLWTYLSVLMYDIIVIRKNKAK